MSELRNGRRDIKAKDTAKYLNNPKHSNIFPQWQIFITLKIVTVPELKDHLKSRALNKMNFREKYEFFSETFRLNKHMLTCY